MSTRWIIDAFVRQYLSKHIQINERPEDRYPQDTKLFVCDCCNKVWQYAWYGEIDIYEDFPTIGKKTKRMPGHEK